jgi:hypothetical protein
VAERWIKRLLALPNLDGAAFALAQLARRTGDRTRDIDDQARQEAVEHLRAIAAPAAWIEMVDEVAELKSGDEARAYGDSLPIGLQLARMQQPAAG